MLGLGGVVLTGSLNLLTSDVSAGSQAFYAFPVPWSAVHLRRPAVVLVTASALVADLVTLLVLLPATAALADSVFFGALLVVIAALLMRATRTQERLVDALQRQLAVDVPHRSGHGRALDEALELALDRPVPGGTALVLVDVDSFEQITDTHGHPVGDDGLVHLAGLLRSRIRSEDAVLSRLGGDDGALLSLSISLGGLTCRGTRVTGAGSTPRPTTRCTTPSGPGAGRWPWPSAEPPRSCRGVRDPAPAVR